MGIFRKHPAWFLAQNDLDDHYDQSFGVFISCPNNKYKILPKRLNIKDALPLDKSLPVTSKNDMNINTQGCLSHF